MLEPRAIREHPPFHLGQSDGVAHPFISKEQLVAADARQEHLDALLRGEARHSVVAVRGDVGHGFVHRLNKRWEKLRHAVGRQFGRLPWNVEALRRIARGRPLVVAVLARIADGERREVGALLARKRRDQTRIDPAAQSNAERRIGSEREIHRLVERGAEAFNGVAVERGRSRDAPVAPWRCVPVLRGHFERVPRRQLVNALEHRLGIERVWK